MECKRRQGLVLILSSICNVIYWIHEQSWAKLFVGISRRRDIERLDQCHQFPGKSQPWQEESGMEKNEIEPQGIQSW